MCRKAFAKKQRKFFLINIVALLENKILSRMSRSPGRRKSILKTIPLIKETPGLLLKFKWSTSAAQLLLLEENPPVMLPSIDTTRTQRRIFNDTRSMTGNK